MRNRMYGGVRGRKMKVGGKLLHFPPTRLYSPRLIVTLRLASPSYFRSDKEIKFILFHLSLTYS